MKEPVTLYIDEARSTMGSGEQILETDISGDIEQIDQLLAKSQIPLSERPFKGAVFFVERYIEVVGDTKDDYLAKPWFKAIYGAFDSWYRDRYGEAMNVRNVPKYTTGVILIYDTPFKLKIPLHVIRNDKTDGTVGLVFPTSVLLEENVLGWIESPPNLEEANLSDEVKSKVTLVAETTRSIKINLTTAHFEDKQTERLAVSVLSHIEKAVEDIVGAGRSGVSVGIWELHFAVEKTIKSFLSQRQIGHSRTHDLKRLNTLAEAELKPPIEPRLFQILPSQKDAIGLRYGERTFTVQDAVGAYEAALEIVNRYSGALQRGFYFRNTEFALKQPPWI